MVIMKSIILDASVFTAWFLDETNTTKAINLQDNYKFHTPEIILFEVSNALWKAKKRKQIKNDEAKILLNALHDIDTITYHSSRRYIKKAYAITEEINHDYIYDCIYLALSIDLNIPLVTADHRFVKKLAKTRYKKNILKLDEA